MKKYLLPLLMMAFISIQSTASTPTPTNQEKDKVLEANQQFFKALNAIFNGELKPMKAIWAKTDDVIYMGPDGDIQVGWKAVLANWEFQASLGLGGQVQPEDVTVIMNGGLAVVQNLVKGQNMVNGEAREVSIRATQVFRNTKNGWKVVSVHTDVISFTDDEDEPIFIFKN